MLTRRPSAERGHFRLDWLDSRHSFSFGHYWDPSHMGHGPLRVINEDVIAPAKGFDTHGHRDMEILTWVLTGALEHHDSLGSGSVIRPGSLQHMSAGTGVMHSEYNASPDEPVHLLQIWLLPDRTGLPPTYGEAQFDVEGALVPVASPDGCGDSLIINQDATLSIGRLAAGQAVSHEMAPGRLGWLQVAAGSATVNGLELAQGDGVAVEDEARLAIATDPGAELLLFDMAPMGRA